MRTFSLNLSWSWDDEAGYEQLTAKEKHELNKYAQHYVNSILDSGNLEGTETGELSGVARERVFFGQWHIEAEGYSILSREEKAWMELQRRDENFVPIIGAEAVAAHLGVEIDPNEVMPNNGAELVAYWQKHGVIGSRTDITDSQVYARQLRHEAEHRNKED